MTRNCKFSLLCFIFVLYSCCTDLNSSLGLAGDNKDELQRVLDHFKDTPNPLKYEAAKFLIENMPYHYSFKGDAVDRFNELYLNTSKVALNKRTEFFNKNADSIKASMPPMYDITTMKAEELIKAIDDACDMWCSSPWHEQYDKEIFFDYVLPYRIEHEPLSDWRQTISEEFPLLTDSVVLSRRGMQFEGEDAEYPDYLHKKIA